jgi:two-component system response regulator PilR (NtrC family)
VLTDAALRALQGYPFPGNVRELENILERAMTLSDAPTLDLKDVVLPRTVIGQKVAEAIDDGPHRTAAPQPAQTATPPAPRSPAEGPLEDYLDDVERQAILKALEETRWNRTAAARKLGMTLRSLRYRLAKLGLD